MTYLFKRDDNYDAFGREKVSLPYTLGDYKQTYANDPNFIDKTANGGTVVFQNNKACTRLSTSSDPASSAIRQSKMYHNYLPGKSQFILCSFTMYGAVTNTTKNVGYFDDRNGIMLRQSGDGTLSFVIRTYTSGSPTETIVPQSSWNKDKCDGTGASKFAVDVFKTQLAWIDFQWLGVGRVRCGFVHDGENVTAHEFYHSNNLANVYLSNPNLPVRTEITNTGTSTGGFIDAICSSVMSEGGYVETGQDLAVTSSSLRSIASGTSLPVIAIRLRPTFQSDLNRTLARMSSIRVLSTGEDIVWKLYKLPDSSFLTGGAWANIASTSTVQYNDGATTMTIGDEIDNGYVTSSSRGVNASGGAPSNSPSSSAKKNYIVQNYDSSNSEIYAVYVTNVGTQTTTVGVGLQWREIF